MVEVNRRQLLKAMGIAGVVGGGGALASSAFNDDETGVSYDGIFYSDNYSQKTQTQTYGI